MSCLRFITGYRVIAILLLGSTVLGVWAYISLRKSDLHLHEAQEALAAVGGAVSVEGCVDAVLQWSQHCTAMKGLCETAVPVMMHRCLAAQDRSAYCHTISSLLTQTSRLGVSECRQRNIGGHGYRQKICSQAYRAIGRFCTDYFPKG